MGANKRTIQVVSLTEASLFAASDSGPKYGLNFLKKTKYTPPTPSKKPHPRNPTQSQQKSLFKPIKLTGSRKTDKLHVVVWPKCSSC